MKNIIFVLTLLLPVPLTFAQDAPAGRSAETTPVLIPIHEISSEADQAHSELQRLNTDLEPSDAIKILQDELPQALDSLRRLRSDNLITRIDDIELRLVNNLRQEWVLYNSRLDVWKASLLRESQKVENIVQRLQAMEGLWQATRENALSEKAPRAISSRISAILKEIKESESKASKYMYELLVRQNSISEEQTAIRDLITKIKETEQNLRGQLFVRDSPSLWEAFKVERGYSDPVTTFL